MNQRIKNYIIVYSFVIAIIVSIINIKVVNTLDNTASNNEESKNIEEHDNKEFYRFILPAIALISFFIGCYFIALIIAAGESTGKDKFSGIIFMFIVGIILLYMNITTLSSENMITYIKGKKFSIIGMFMALGVSSIVFGFLDNFGMKLGTEALDDNFLQAFLSPFSVDTRFKKYSTNISNNLKTINKWVSSDWRKVMNHTLRFKDSISKNPEYKDLTNAINKFGGSPLKIPQEIINNSELTNSYVDNLRDKFDIIDGSKAMMGNTFSDFIGALLGAAVISLFMYMTTYDGTIVSEENENSVFVKYLGYYAPIMEAVFIAFGCMVPIFLNIAMTRMDNNTSNFWSWVIVGIVFVVVIIMMYLSVQGIQDMNVKDKKYSIKKTIEGLKERIDLIKGRDEEETQLEKKVQDFIESI